MAKLTDRQVEEIRQLRSELTLDQMAERYGISRGHARKVRDGKSRPSNKDADLIVNVEPRTDLVITPTG